MRKPLIFLLATALVGCGSSDPEPVQGDNPAASAGRDVTPDMQKTGGPPRNTLPAGQGRSGGGGGGTEGAASR